MFPNVHHSGIPVTTRRPRRRVGSPAIRLSTDERRRQLLDASREVIRHHGLASVTMERVAAEAGVSKPVVYAHFPNRGRLLVALLEEFWMDLDGHLLEDDNTRSSITAFARAVTNNYFDALERGGPSIQEVLSSGSEEPDVDSARRARSANIDEIWSKYYERSLSLPADIARLAAAVLRSAIVAAGAFWLAHPEADRETCVDGCVAIINGSLKELRKASATSDRRT